MQNYVYGRKDQTICNLHFERFYWQAQWTTRNSTVSIHRLFRVTFRENILVLPE